MKRASGVGEQSRESVFGVFFIHISIMLQSYILSKDILKS